MPEADPRALATADAPDSEAQDEPGTARRRRFRSAIADLSQRSTSNDLVRWMLVPGSLAVLLGFVAMVLGWVGAARTARQIEQVPYLISGGLVGLALVVLGGLLLVSTFWVAVVRKLQDEADGRATREVEELRARLAALEAIAPSASRAKRTARTTPKRTGAGATASNGAAAGSRAVTRP